jgi:site-specific DNA-methyltransferase (adenine-specific)
MSQFTLVEGDVLDCLAEIPDQSIHCIVTSPPYNIGKNYGDKVDDKKPMNEYLDWIAEVFLDCKRVLTDDGSLFVNVGYSSTQPWIAMDVAQALRKDWFLQNNITWVKNVSIGEESYGHFKPIQSKRFLNVTNESILHFTKTGDVEIHRLEIGVPFKWKCNLKPRGKDKDGNDKPEKADVRCRGNSWFIPYETIKNNEKDRGGHPASFPVELAEKCIKIAVGKNTDAVVLDPFLGSGTTLVACNNLGLRGTGFDINPEFLEFAQLRVSDKDRPSPS